MKGRFKKFVSVALSIMLCASAIPASFVVANAATVMPKVASGNSHTVVLKSDGTVWAAGSNQYGQLGVDSSKVPNGSEDDKTPTFTQCVDDDGQFIQDATDVACGEFHTAIIRTNGEVWQCGRNNHGQLGNRSIEDKPVFVKSYKSSDGNYLASPDSSNTEAITGVTQIACGAYYTAIIINGEVWQCGYNDYGQFGNTGVDTNSKYSAVFVKSYKSKSGDYIATPDSSDIEDITEATRISCGFYHTSVILNNGEVWQCGYNYNGQLSNMDVGTGNADNNYSVVFIKSYKSKSGDYIASPDSSNTEAITGATQIACGNRHTAVILNDGEIWQCGSNFNGQIGNVNVKTGRVDNNYSSVFVKSYKSKNGNYLASPSSSDIEAITGATQIACAWACTAIILNNGEVWQCGSNYNGQLSNTDIGTGDSERSTLFLKSSNIANANELSTGCNAYHTMALCIENDIYTLYGAGRNNNSQLGLGDAAGTDDVLTFTKSTTIDYIGKYYDTLTSINESKSRKVTGAGQFVGGYRLDIEWRSLQYTYTATWNAKESKWDGDWKAADDNDKIVVKNASAVPCKVEFAFGTNDGFKSPSDGQPGTKGTFTDPSVADEPALDTTTNTVPLAVYAAATPATSQKTVKLGLEGIPNAKAGIDIDDATTVGSVTVTLKNADS